MDKIHSEMITPYVKEKCDDRKTNVGLKPRGR